MAGDGPERATMAAQAPLPDERRGVRLRGGQALLDGRLVAADIGTAGGRIALDPTGAAGLELDARGLLVLPGVVDIHGDAFERQVQPRPGVAFPMALALAETERQLLASGITTALHAVTLSWEPGLRGGQTWRALLDGLAARTWACDMRVHLRLEAHALDELPMALDDIAAGRVALLAFNDHTPSILRALPDAAKARKYSERAGMTPEAFATLAHAASERLPEVAAARVRAAAAARAAGLPMASHDDATEAARAGFRALGARICEFPMAEAVGRAAREAGEAVVMGAPNVVRGGSHLGWGSAAPAAEAGLCTVLASDYYYPCMVQAAFALVRRGRLGLPDSWALVSANPAAAAGLADRGTLAAGMRADVVVVDDRGAMPEVVATVAGGRLAWVGDAGAARLRAG